jgi:hypothetical protein
LVGWPVGGGGSTTAAVPSEQARRSSYHCPARSRHDFLLVGYRDPLLAAMHVGSVGPVSFESKPAVSVSSSPRQSNPRKLACQVSPRCGLGCSASPEIDPATGSKATVPEWLHRGTGGDNENAIMTNSRVRRISRAWAYPADNRPRAVRPGQETCAPTLIRANDGHDLQGRSESVHGIRAFGRRQDSIGAGLACPRGGAAWRRARAADQCSEANKTLRWWRPRSYVFPLGPISLHMSPVTAKKYAKKMGLATSREPTTIGTGRTNKW